MSSEVRQFAGMIGFFVVALVLWLRIAYLPRRTLERREDQRVEADKKPGRQNPPAGELHTELLEEAPR